MKWKWRGIMTEQMNIYQKLIEVRKSVPYLKKEAEGKQYKYTGSSQVLASVRAKMDELGLLLIPRITGKEISESQIEFKDASGNVTKRTTTYFTELIMTMTWINAEKPDETIECPWYGQGVDIAGEKGVGKALTYAEKYFILKQFNIATDKDDPDAFQEKNQPPEPKKPLLLVKWKTLGGEEEKFEEWYQGQLDKNFNETQMEKYLTTKLIEKKKGA